MKYTKWDEELGRYVVENTTQDADPVKFYIHSTAPEYVNDGKAGHCLVAPGRLRVYGEIIDRLAELENKEELRPRGEWSYEGYTGEYIGGTDAPLSFKCSICGALEVLPSRYCPHCGAKMGEEAKNNDQG